MSNFTSSKRTKWSVSVIACLLIGVAWFIWPKAHPPALPEHLETAKEQRQRLEGATVVQAHPVAAPTPSPAIAKDFPDNLYDPDVEGSDPELGLPVTLDRERLDALLRGMEDMRSTYIAYAWAAGLYERVQAEILSPKVKETLFQRIANGRGFKHPELPAEWSKYAKEGTDRDLPAVLTGVYMDRRFDRIKSQVISGSVRNGDILFVQKGAVFMHGRLTRAEEFLATAERLYGWLGEDSVLEPDEALALDAEARCAESAAAMRALRDYLNDMAVHMDTKARYQSDTARNFNEHMNLFVCIPALCRALESSASDLDDKSVSPTKRLLRARRPIIQTPDNKTLDAVQVARELERHIEGFDHFFLRRDIRPGRVLAAPATVECTVDPAVLKAFRYQADNENDENEAYRQVLAEDGKSGPELEACLREHYISRYSIVRNHHVRKVLRDTYGPLTPTPKYIYLGQTARL